MANLDVTDGPVLVSVADRVATVTLNRPEARNALNREVQQLLPETVARLDADPGVDVLVLTGTDPAFSAGVDLKELGGTGDTDLVLPRDRRGPFPPRTKPLIAAVNGAAITGGFELVLACDFVIASEHARFADTHARVGVMPGWGLTVLLPQAIGVRRAREMSLTGNFIDAEAALAWGLVNHVTPHEDLLPFCHKLAADIVSNDQAGVQRMLATYAEVCCRTVDEGWDIEAEVARAWARDRLDPAEVERRRAAIVARGRAQSAGDT